MIIGKSTRSEFSKGNSLQLKMLQHRGKKALHIIRFYGPLRIQLKWSIILLVASSK
jgi:hypothetical protein